jgi:hypothetical protein
MNCPGGFCHYNPLCCFSMSVYSGYTLIWGSGGIAPHILNLSTKWRWVVSFTPKLLCPQGQSRQYPLDSGLGGPQNQSACDKKKDTQNDSGWHTAVANPLRMTLNEIKILYTLK